MAFGRNIVAKFLCVVVLVLGAGTAVAVDDAEEKAVLSTFIGEVDSIISFAKDSAKDIPGFSVNSFVNEMNVIRHSIEEFIDTGHADQSGIGEIHGEYGSHLGKQRVFTSLYEKVLLLDEHVHAAKANADPSHHVEYEILEIELDIVEVGLEGVMRGG